MTPYQNIEEAGTPMRRIDRDRGPHSHVYRSLDEHQMHQLASNKKNARDLKHKEDPVVRHEFMVDIAVDESQQLEQEISPYNKSDFKIRIGSPKNMRIALKARQARDTTQKIDKKPIEITIPTEKVNTESD